MGSGNLNPGPHIWMAHVLPAQPSPLSLRCILDYWPLLSSIMSLAWDGLNAYTFSNDVLWVSFHLQLRQSSTERKDCGFSWCMKCTHSWAYQLRDKHKHAWWCHFPHIILREVITYTRGPSRKGCRPWVCRPALSEVISCQLGSTGWECYSQAAAGTRPCLMYSSHNSRAPSAWRVHIPLHNSALMMPNGFGRKDVHTARETTWSGPYAYRLWWEESLSRLGHTMRTLPDSSSTQEQDLTGS